MLRLIDTTIQLLIFSKSGCIMNKVAFFITSAQFISIAIGHVGYN